MLIHILDFSEIYELTIAFFAYPDGNQLMIMNEIDL